MYLGIIRSESSEKHIYAGEHKLHICYIMLSHQKGGGQATTTSHLVMEFYILFLFTLNKTAFHAESLHIKRT